MRGTWKELMRLLVAILCLIPMMALADYPDPKRKQGSIDIFTNTMTHPQGMVVVTGSSSVLRWRSIYKDLAPTRIIATSIAETNMNDLDYYLEEMVLRYRPRAVVIYQGENDLKIDCVSVEQVVRTFNRIVTRINTSYSNISIYFISIKPSVARWHKWPEAARINERVAAMASEIDFLKYVDVAGSMLDREGLPRAELFVEDGVHLNDEGYRIWTSILQPILADLP